MSGIFGITLLIRSIKEEQEICVFILPKGLSCLRTCLLSDNLMCFTKGMTGISDFKGEKREGQAMTSSANVKRVSLNPLRRISSVPINNSPRKLQKNEKANQTNIVTQFDVYHH